MSATAYGWREAARVLYEGPSSPTDALSEGVHDLAGKVFLLRALGVEVTLKGGRYAIPRTEANVDHLLALLQRAEGQHG